MCDHLHVEIYATGGMHFTPTDGPWDDYHFWATCTDCGETHNVDGGDWPDPAPTRAELTEAEQIPI